MVRQHQLLRCAALALSCSWLLAAPLAADPLDQQLLEDTPPKAALPVKPTAPLLGEKPELQPAPSPATPRTNSDQPLDARHPLTRIAGKMELVERRLSTGFDPTIVGMQRDIIVDLDRLLTPGEPKNIGNPKEDTSKQNPGQEDSNKQDPGKQSNNKQPQNKQSGHGPEAPNGSGTGHGDNEPRKPSPRELMEKTWGNLPARERERVFEAAGETFIPKYSRSLRQYFERLAEEDASQK